MYYWRPAFVFLHTQTYTLVDKDNTEYRMMTRTTSGHKRLAGHTRPGKIKYRNKKHVHTTKKKKNIGPKELKWLSQTFVFTFFLRQVLSLLLRKVFQFFLFTFQSSFWIPIWTKQGHYDITRGAWTEIQRKMHRTHLWSKQVEEKKKQNQLHFRRQWNEETLERRKNWGVAVSRSAPSPCVTVTSDSRCPMLQDCKCMAVWWCPFFFVKRKIGGNHALA